MKAELMINGPKGQAFASIEVGSNGVTIYPAEADAALACALNIYNELPTPSEEELRGESWKASL